MEGDVYHCENCGKTWNTTTPKARRKPQRCSVCYKRNIVRQNVKRPIRIGKKRSILVAIVIFIISMIIPYCLITYTNFDSVEKQENSVDIVGVLVTLSLAMMIYISSLMKRAETPRRILGLIHTLCLFTFSVGTIVLMILILDPRLDVLSSISLPIMNEIAFGFPFSDLYKIYLIFSFYQLIFLAGVKSLALLLGAKIYRLHIEIFDKKSKHEKWSGLFDYFFLFMIFLCHFIIFWIF